MKGIWHKYKIWILIGGFYAAYGVVKGIKMVKHIHMPKIKLSADRSNLKCGWPFPTDSELLYAFCAKKFWNLSLTGHVDCELDHGSATNPDELKEGSYFLLGGAAVDSFITNSDGNTTWFFS